MNTLNCKYNFENKINGELFYNKESMLNCFLYFEFIYPKINLKFSRYYRFIDIDKILWDDLDKNLFYQNDIDFYKFEYFIKKYLKYKIFI